MRKSETGPHLEGQFPVRQGVAWFLFSWVGTSTFPTLEGRWICPPVFPTFPHMFLNTGMYAVASGTQTPESNGALSVRGVPEENAIQHCRHLASVLDVRKSTPFRTDKTL